MGSYKQRVQVSTIRILEDEEIETVIENVKYNVTNLADEHPETTFYYFFPPYSICNWEMLKCDGKIDWQIDSEQVAIEEILKHPNIKLYSFNNNFDLICNLDNYKDWVHYGEWVNSYMLKCMYNEEYMLTNDNYKEYIQTIREFYNSYDYGLLRE